MKTQKKSAPPPKSNRTALFIGAVAILLLAFVVGQSFYSSSKQEQAAGAAPSIMSMLDRPHAISMGPANAPVVIVEFLDPACETCAAFYPMVKQLMAANSGKIRLVIRYAPFHAGSPAVVAALEAARKQDKYWPAIEALLSAQDRWTQNHTAHVDLALPLLESQGLDLTRLKQDMSSPEVAQIISQDMADVRALNVSKTPEYFVNGKPLPSFGWMQLKTLVEEALANAGR